MNPVPSPSVQPLRTLPASPGRTTGRFLAAFVVLGFSLHAASLPVFDFTDPTQNAQWSEPHHLARTATTTEGFVLTLGGNDPWIVSPPRDFPTGQPLWLHFRLKSEQAGTAQLFYFPATGHASEPNSVRFPVKGGDWVEVKLRLPALGPAHRLRFDPPGARGTCVLGRLWFTERTLFTAPNWPRPAAPELGADAVTIESGDLKVVHNRTQHGGFVVEVAGQQMAVGHTSALIGYLREGKPRWFAVNHSNATVTVSTQPLSLLADAHIGGVLRSRVTCTDPEGGRWQLEHTFRLNNAGTLQFEASARCDVARDVLHLPLFTLLPGLGTFGTNKTQALLAGVEYLENEPSSSTADLNPPDSNRQVTDTAKLTFPLMAIASQDRYLGLAWHQPPGAPTCAVFDTPDRLFNSGAQLMGLLFPGSDGLNREEHSLVPYDAVQLRADRPVQVTGLLLGGRGQTVIPAVQEYVRLYGLPPLPEMPGDAAAYLRLAAQGWLDSRVRDGDLYRHAAPGFGSMPAADAALYQDWLATQVGPGELATRLVAAAQAALAKVPPANRNSAQVGHVRYPAPALVYGAVSENLARAEQHARGQLGRFEADGFIRYRQSPGALDYGRTHRAPDANGLTAQVLGVVLSEAAFTGSPALIEAGLRHLRALTVRYGRGVPRGAQTWEIPLHTPDILASAYLVRCYVLGYELSGDAGFLDEAKYWAWTGVPFVYLVSPTDAPVGRYATIPVLGATQWVAPNWIGLPVQWCGLAYAEALQRLAVHDSTGPWTRLADGIVISGIQQTYPDSDPDDPGLLPDSFNLRGQTRNPANINPATLLAPAIRTLERPLLYDFRALPKRGLHIHAPGAISDVAEREDGVTFTVRGWSPRPYVVLVNGLRQAPQLRINSQATPLAAPHEYQESAGRLLIQIRREAAITLSQVLP